MKLLTGAGACALAIAFAVVACNTDSPTAPMKTVPQSGSLDRSGPTSRGQTLSFDATGPVSNAASAVVGNFAGTFTVTKFGFDQATRQLLVTGVLNGVITYLDGTTAPTTISNETLTTTATLKKGTQVSSSAGSIYQLAQATCGILLLDLGPLHLDLLGLVVDLNEVILNITAQSGANNLLGNLLCAVTGLLDLPGAIAGIINLLNSINNLLGAVGGLAAPASGPIPLSVFPMVAPGIAALRSA
ncbi:MAG TPA: hypothetical protein VJ852_11000 [Gemmatimonadaceae bacterium]|nr:hypothetical protein [Gemmatimonadaceae bacterium]